MHYVIFSTSKPRTAESCRRTQEECRLWQRKMEDLGFTIECLDMLPGEKEGIAKAVWLVNAPLQDISKFTTAISFNQIKWFGPCEILTLKIHRSKVGGKHFAKVIHNPTGLEFATSSYRVEECRTRAMDFIASYLAAGIQLLTTSPRPERGVCCPHCGHPFRVGRVASPDDEMNYERRREKMPVTSA